MLVSSQIGRSLCGILLASSLAACQTLGPGGLTASRAMPELSPAASQMIADDMTARLTEVAAPQAILIKVDDTAFGTALESSLTHAGYTVASTDEKTAAGLSLAYVVEEFEGSVLARLSTESADLGRVYRVTADSAEPASPVSIKRRS